MTTDAIERRYSPGMLAKFFLILTVALVCSGECVQVGPPQYGRVEVLAFDALNERIPSPGIDLIEVGSRKSFKSKFHGAMTSQIPYGWYMVRVSAPGFRSMERELRLDQPKFSLRTQLSVSVECGGYARVNGSIHPAPGARQLWVKLVPVIGTGDSEAPVNQNGDFLIGGLDYLDYLLLILDGKSIIHTANVQASDGRERVNVDLGQR
jgi:hypothetical protein